MTDLMLSLCVPTYNRAAFLRETLERMACQISEADSACVEIVVSDNASTDDTPLVLSKMQAAYPEVTVRVLRQPSNQGPDANIYAVIKAALGEFVYVLSDDDVLLPGAVAKLLELMRVYPQADALTLNIKSFVDSPDDPAPLWFAIQQDTFFADKSDALRTLALSHLFLSMTAFRRTLAVRDYSDKIGTNLLQSFLFFDVLARGRGAAVSAAPFLAQRLDNTGGYGFFEVMVTHYQSLLRYGADAGLPADVLREFHVKQLKTSIFHFLIRYKMMSERYNFHLPFWDGSRRLVRAYGLHPFLLFPILPLMLMPAPLLRRLWRGYRVVRYGPRRAAAMAGVQGAGL